MLRVMAQLRQEVIAVGSTVRVRSVRPLGTRSVVTWLRGDYHPEQVISIVAPADMGLYRLTPRTPLGKALLGHRAGDVVSVHVGAGVVQIEIVSVQPDAAAATGGWTYAEVGTAVPAAAAVCDPIASGEHEVHVGDVVHVRDGEIEEWWRIVPGDQADAKRRWISVETPMARALLGRRAGEQVRIERPGGRWPVMIIAVESRAVVE